MNRSRIVRWQRPVWTAGCGIVVVLLWVLWVRSYWQYDNVHARVYKNWSAVVICLDGCAMLRLTDHTQTSALPSAQPRFQRQSGSTSTLGMGVVPWQASWRSKPIAGDGITLPFWFSVVAGTLTALPWLPWPRWQFSLRTLLIAMTFLSALLGFIAWSMT